MLFNLPIFRKIVITDAVILVIMFAHYLLTDTAADILTYVAILCVVGFVSAVIMALFFQNRIDKLQHQLSPYLGAGRHESRDLNRLSVAVEQMLDTYRSRGETIEALEQEVAQLQTEVGQLSSASNSKSAGQDMYLQQAENALNDIAGMIEQVADVAESVSASSNAVKSDIFGCCENLSASAQATKADAEFISGFKGQVQQLGQGVSTINSLALEINDISDQTNLLALNAAIEAARAGEQGRGFAVVADEVRNLATRARASSAKIEQSIESVVKEAEASSKAIEKISANVDQAVIYTHAEQETMQGISDRLSDVTEQIAQVVAMLAEQKSAVQAARGHFNSF